MHLKDSWGNRVGTENLSVVLVVAVYVYSRQTSGLRTNGRHIKQLRVVHPHESMLMNNMQDPYDTGEAITIVWILHILPH